MTSQAPQGKEKFFFDKNIFDEKEEPAEPPPPMFSEAELAATQKKGFTEGKAAGLKESADSRDQQVAQILASIEKNVATLFAAETAREKTYEAEVIKLCLAVFQKAFPLYQEKFGMAEMQQTLQTILRRQEGQKQIAIYVPPDVAEGVGQQISKIKDKAPDLNITVQADEALRPGHCRLSWADGGAVRNPDALAAEIEGAFKDLLAGAAAKVHDG